MKKIEEPVTLQAFLEQTRAKGASIPRPIDPVSSKEARELLKKMVDDLADLADAGDVVVQNLLMDFAGAGRYLIATAPKPAEQCAGAEKE